MNTQERIVALVREQLGVGPEACTSSARLEEDLGADSLDRVELVMAVEEEFEIEVPDEEADKWTTVGAIFQYVEARVPA